MSLDLKLADASVDPRPVRECLRCSYIWRQAEVQGKPRWCPRCGSAVWDEEPRRRNSRRPGDPPNPNWKQRKREAFIRNGRTIQPDSRPGIPRNYILEPYVPKASVSGGLPPPPSRVTTGLPPPPHITTLPSLDEQNTMFRAEVHTKMRDSVMSFPVPDVEYAIAAAQGENE